MKHVPTGHVEQVIVIGSILGVLAVLALLWWLNILTGQLRVELRSDGSVKPLTQIDKPVYEVDKRLSY